MFTNVHELLCTIQFFTMVCQVKLSLGKTDIKYTSRGLAETRDKLLDRKIPPKYIEFVFYFPPVHFTSTSSYFRWNKFHKNRRNFPPNNAESLRQQRRKFTYPALRIDTFTLRWSPSNNPQCVPKLRGWPEIEI